MSNSPVTAANPCRPNPQIPAAIQQNGIFEQILGRSRIAASQTQTAKQLHETLGRALASENLVRSGQSFYPSAQDTVFAYLLALQLGDGDVAQRLRERAFVHYLKSKGDYDLVLGELIPENFRDCADREIAHRAYLSGSNKSAADDIPVFVQRLKSRRAQQRGARGISTGLDALDAALGGGLFGTSFLGGLPASGKTSLALQITDAALSGDPQLGAMIWTPDMTKDEYLARWICRDALIDRQSLESRDLSTEVSDRFFSTFERLQEQKLSRVCFVDERTPIDGRLIDVMSRKIDEFLQGTQAARFLLVLDYFRLLPPRRNAEDPDRSRVDFLDRLRRFAETCGDRPSVVILAISEIKKGATPTDLAIEDLLGSCRIGYSADSVLLRQGAERHLDQLPELLATRGLAPFAESAEQKVPVPLVPPSLLLVGDVDYGGDPGVLLASDRGMRAVRDGESKWIPLPGTRGEIDAIHDSFEQKVADGKIKQLRQQQATAEAVREAAPNYRYLHFATHGFFADPKTRSALALTDKPESNFDRGAMLRRATGEHPGLLSGIVLTGANQPPVDGKGDGILTALEVGELDLSGVDLATLSACESGLGKTAGGEGVLGLQRAFQTAGARTTVTSLWKIPDDATRSLMIDFYENLWTKKMSKIEALRQAQLTLMREGVDTLAGAKRGLEFEADQPPDADHRLPPYYWAAFVLSGDWR